MVKTVKLTLKKEYKSAKVETLRDMPKVAIVTATKNYIPIEEFKEVFTFIGNLVSQEGINKLIFDKRKLTVFHQPSMEWYFIEWNDKMYDLGLRVYRKILPDNDVFRDNFTLGLKLIEDKYPNGKFHKMDIQYCESLEEAIGN